ncbi:DUF3734 domain-containing protein [Orrella marina]|uniref:PNPLA domain-containing protein n=1 Tax=Orrella marina TaxID=2163011 RepID=A0A2R4XJY6_9BURK|nr:hypothetical protein DBV39_10860 [Orrella marina]
MINSRYAKKIQEYPKVALVLQGGGALGSYQAGVYEGLAHAGIHPNWVAGISIGALNCAIIAGNPPEKRVERLHEFWDTICSPPMCPVNWMEGLFGGVRSDADKATANPFASMFSVHSPVASPWASWFDGAAQTMLGSMSAMSSIINGQHGFFKPRVMAPGSGSPDVASFYDTSPIIETLERLADFDRINSGETRVSLGATNVASGNFVYFDSEKIKLTPKHFVASGSLPPGFPATEIDGEFYWDGGCVSNTPLEYVLGSSPRKDTLVFQVDLWSAQGSLPTDIFQVNERLKDIQYSSRTRTVTNVVHLAQQMRKVLIDTVDRIPQEVRDNDPWFDEMVRRMMGARYNVIHLIYQNKSTEGHYKDYQFSHETMRMHWQTGQHDMNETLEYPDCLDMPAEGENFVTFDVHTRKRSSSQFHGRPGSSESRGSGAQTRSAAADHAQVGVSKVDDEENAVEPGSKGGRATRAVKAAAPAKAVRKTAGAKGATTRSATRSAAKKATKSASETEGAKVAKVSSATQAVTDTDVTPSDSRTPPPQAPE